jgi:hypothetical protein
LTDSEGFFEERGFGEDTEGSVVMSLRPGSGSGAAAAAAYCREGKASRERTSAQL